MTAKGCKTPKKFVEHLVYLENVHDCTKALARHSFYPVLKETKDIGVNGEMIPYLIKVLDGDSNVVPKKLKDDLSLVASSSRMNLSNMKNMENSIVSMKDITDDTSVLQPLVFLQLYSHGVALAVATMNEKGEEPVVPIRAGKFVGVRTEEKPYPNDSVLFEINDSGLNDYVNSDDGKLKTLAGMQCKMIVSREGSSMVINPRVLLGLYLKSLEDQGKAENSTSEDIELWAAEDKLRKEQSCVDIIPKGKSKMGTSDDSDQGPVKTRTPRKTKSEKWIDEIDKQDKVDVVLHKAFNYQNSEKNSKQKSDCIAHAIKKALALGTNKKPEELDFWLENDLTPADFELNKSDETSDPNLKDDVLVEKNLKRLPEHRKIVESDIVGWVNDGFEIEQTFTADGPKDQYTLSFQEGQTNYWGMMIDNPGRQGYIVREKAIGKVFGAINGEGPWAGAGWRLAEAVDKFGKTIKIEREKDKKDKEETEVRQNEGGKSVEENNGEDKTDDMNNDAKEVVKNSGKRAGSQKSPTASKKKAKKI